MPKFRLMKAKPGPNSFPVAPHQHEGHWYEPGSVLESQSDLTLMFPGKFERVSDSAKTTPKPATSGHSHLGIRQVDDPDASLGIGSDPVNVNDLREDDEREPQEALKPVPKSPREQREEGGEEEDDKKPAKKDTAKTKSPDKGDMEDVTDKFPRASGADLTVHHSAEEGFVVKDKDKVISKDRLTTKAKVNKFLKEHIGDKPGADDDDDDE